MMLSPWLLAVLFPGCQPDRPVSPGRRSPGGLVVPLALFCHGPGPRPRYLVATGKAEAPPPTTPRRQGIRPLPSFSYAQSGPHGPLVVPVAFYDLDGPVVRVSQPPLMS